LIEKERHLFIIYDILFIFVAILYFPYLVWKGKWHKGFSVRLGFVSDAFVGRIKGKKNIWIHAVSVGEVLAILDLIDRLKEVLPEYRIVCSTVTKTGYKLAEDKLKDKAVVFYAPLDFSWIVRKFINIIDPKVYIST